MTARISDNPIRRSCRELDRRLRAGDSVRAEDFLDDDLDPEDAVEIVYSEFVCREELGQHPTTTEYLARFPRLRGPLEEQFLVHAALHDDSPARPESPIRGQNVGPYSLERELGRGSRGAVFEARDSRTGDRVALKLLLTGEYSTPDDLALFRHEASVLGRLDHPNLIRIVDAGVANGRPYLALEFADGPTLAGRIGDYRTPNAAAELVEILARAVDHAHDQGVVHRDLKPSNVLLMSTGVPKVSDFGLARVVDGDAGNGRTRTGDIVGTLGYMAPEQAAGTGHRAGPAADVYALGAILFELLTGRTPFGPDSSAQTLYRLLHEPPPSPHRLASSVPRDLETVCLKCLEKAPENRYPTALALAEDLRRFRDGIPVSARPPGTATQVARWAIRRPSTAALVGVVVLGLVGTLVASLYHAAALQTELDTAERLRSETKQANDDLHSALEKLELQLDDARRSMYALQMSQLPALWSREPIRARTLLADKTACPPDLQDFTWRYYQRACRLDEIDIPGPKGAVTATVAMPNGGLAAAGDDGKVRIWTAGEWKKPAATFSHGKPVVGLALVGDRLASVGRDKVLKLWPTSADGNALSAKIPSMPTGVATSADASCLAVPCEDGSVRLFAADLTPSDSLDAHRGPATAVAFAPDGTLATSGKDRRIVLWNPAAKKIVREWIAHSGTVRVEVKDPTPPFGAVRALAFSPTGHRLASVGDAGEAGLWDPATGNRVHSLGGHLYTVRAVAFSPDGDLVATGGEDTYLKLWNAATGAELTNVMRQRTISTAFSRDGSRAFSGSPTGRLYSYAVPAFSPDVEYPLSANLVRIAARLDAGPITGDASGQVRIWEAGNPVPKKSIQVGEGPVRALAVDPAGTQFAVGCGNDAVLYDLDGRELRRLRGHTGEVTALRFDPSGTRLATGSADKSVRIWNATDDRPIHVLAGHTDTVECLAFSPAGDRLASSSDDHTVRLWDAASGTCTGTLKGHSMWVLTVAFDPTGRYLASGSRDRTVRIWDTTGVDKPLVLAGFTNWVYGVAYSPDGKTLAAAAGHYSLDTTGELKFYDPKVGYVRAIVTEVRAPLAFSPDNRRLYVGARGGVTALEAD